MYVLYLPMSVQSSMYYPQVDNPRRVGSSSVDVRVSDLNDNRPIFSHAVYAVSIMENLPAGFSVMQVAATDDDEVGGGLFVFVCLRERESMCVCAYFVMFLGGHSTINVS